MDYLSNYLPIIAVLVVSVLVGLAMLAAAAFLGPKVVTAVKAAPFECGSNPVGSARQRFAVKFYVVALLFIVFDLEIVFLFPWAVIFKELAWFGFLEMAVFAVLLAVGLAYVWRRGALEWE